MTELRVLICAGGSGGGVYPALSVWQEMETKVDEVIWIGGEGGMEEELVKRAGIPYRSIPAAGVHGVGWRTLSGMVQNGRGYLAARRIIREFQPDVMFFTGGYVAVPVALAGRNRPILLYVPDIEPGLALKILARFADHITLIADDSRKYFSKRVRATVTGHPTRKGLADWSKERALSSFGLTEELPLLLVFGGSKGARSINQAVLANLPELLAHMQILHISGQSSWPQVQEVQAGLSEQERGRYRAFAYLHSQMGAAYAAADLVLSRGGASAVGEFPIFGLPAILVPYPHAWRYQMVNAEYLARHGAAVILPDEKLPDEMLATVLDLMGGAPRRAKMQAAMHSLAHPDAAHQIAEIAFELAGGA